MQGHSPDEAGITVQCYDYWVGLESTPSSYDNLDDDQLTKTGRQTVF